MPAVAYALVALNKLFDVLLDDEGWKTMARRRAFLDKLWRAAISAKQTIETRKDSKKDST